MKLGLVVLYVICQNVHQRCLISLPCFYGGEEGVVVMMKIERSVGEDIFWVFQMKMMKIISFEFFNFNHFLKSRNC